MIRLLAIDVDGTLIPHASARISRRVYDAIQEAQKRVLIVLCTGRSEDEIEEILDQLDLIPGYHVVGGGATVIAPDGSLLSSQKLSRDELSLLERETKDLGLRSAYLLGSDWISPLSPSHRDEVGVYSVQFATIQDAMNASEKLAHLRDRFSLGAVTNGPQDTQHGYLLISGKEASKGSGLLRVLSALKIAPAEVMAIGDMPNDLPMFEVAGLSVAMGNAPDSVKERAHKVVPDVTQDGVAVAIEQFILSTIT